MILFLVFRRNSTYKNTLKLQQFGDNCLNVINLRIASFFSRTLQIIIIVENVHILTVMMF